MSTITVSAGLSTPRPRRPRRAATAPSAATASPARQVRSTAARSTPARSTPVHLTRRGRLLLTVLSLLTLVVLGVLATGGAPASAGSERGEAAVAERVTVRPGDTLWAIAVREAPGVDPRETVAAILDLNALESSAVEAGSVLLLPQR